MNRPSSVDKLPEEIREQINTLRGRGWSIDQIREKLFELFDSSPSRSSLGRYIQGADKLAGRMRFGRMLAEQLGRAPDGKSTMASQINIELINGAIMEIFMKRVDDNTDDEGSATVTLGPKEIRELAQAVHLAAQAQRSNVEFIDRVRTIAADQARADAVRAVEHVAKAGGITPETLARVRTEIYGLRPSASPPAAPC